MSAPFASIAFAKSPAHERFVREFSGQLQGRYFVAWLVGLAYLGGPRLRAEVERELGNAPYRPDGWYPARDCVLLFDRAARAGISVERLGELVLPAYKRSHPGLLDGRSVEDAFGVLEHAYREHTTYGGVSPPHEVGPGSVRIFRTGSPAPCAYFVGVMKGLLSAMGLTGKVREVACQWEGAASCCFEARWSSAATASGPVALPSAQRASEVPPSAQRASEVPPSAQRASRPPRITLPPGTTPKPATPSAPTRREGALPAMAAQPPEASPCSPPPPGTVMGGKYRVERVIGSGGMGIVLAARHLSLDQPVAIKLLRPELGRDPNIVARFLREGRAAAKIGSEHVARVFDADRFEPWGPALVLELLEGRDFHALLRDPTFAPLPVPVAVDYLLQAAEAIAEAHARGIVHRDLKPHNLFLARRADGSTCVKVLDFGISKVSPVEGEDDVPNLTDTGAALGTPRYMAPEQMRAAHSADARSDIWALGAILFELVAGRAPFVARSTAELCATVLTAPPPRLRDLVPDAPAALDEAILRCLEKDPDRRFEDLGELAKAIAVLGAPSTLASAERIARVVGTTSSRRSAVPVSMERPATERPATEAEPAVRAETEDSAPSEQSGIRRPA